MITWDEVREFGSRWFDTTSEGSAAEQAAFFLDPNARIHVVSTGATFDFDTHAKLHTQWINERHIFADFALTQLSASPERVRAVDTVYWQAEYPGRPPPSVVKAIVGE